MARYKVSAVLIGTLVVLAGAGIGLDFDVTVQPTVEGQFIAFDHDNSTAPLHRFTVSAGNTGSVTCGYRMTATFERANQTITRYSAEQIIYPGEQQLLELEYLPYNYTGPVWANVSVEYCDHETQLGSTAFTVDERLRTNRTLTSRTVRSGNTSATVELPVDSGIMLPEQAPAYWKPAAARIINGTAVVRYDPPLFDRQEQLEYTVYDPQQGAVIGTVTVGLEEEPTLTEQLWRHRVLVGLAVSVLINLLLAGLLYRRHGRSTAQDAAAEDPT